MYVIAPMINTQTSVVLLRTLFTRTRNVSQSGTSTAMAVNFNSLLDALTPDPWREKTGFSQDIAKANERLFASDGDEDARMALCDWIAQHQPCLFGRMAAKADLLSFCILTESDLRAGPGPVRDRIQQAREEWLAFGHEGAKSAFIILVASPQLAVATPDATVRTIAEALCSLYLLRPIASDEFCFDEMFLEKPGTKRQHGSGWRELITSALRVTSAGGTIIGFRAAWLSWSIPSATL